MSKIGVGIGEDFPVDETEPRPAGSPNDDAAAWAAHREAHRAWRRQRREWKRRWREEWREHRRRFHAQFAESYWDDRGARPSMVMGHPFFWGRHALWRVLAVVGIIAIVALALSHIYFLLGALVVGLLCLAAFRHGVDPFDLGPHDDRDERHAPPTNAERPAQEPRDNIN